MTDAIDKKFSAVCGLFCPACTFYIGTREEPERLKAIARRIGRPVEELECQGCRMEKRSFYCTSVCTMAKCAASKGVDFCGQCPEYPCSDLKNFQAAMPHRIELWKSQERIKEAGYETWYAEMTKHFSCRACGAMNSAYDLKCRKCGKEPGSEFVRMHKEELVERSRDMR